MSSFGRHFIVTTFGESHGKSVGAIVDGCPPGLALSEADIQPQLTRRRPGQNNLTTPRVESDLVTIQSGVENGYTLGTPIGLIVPNLDQFPKDYSSFADVPRPGHADFTYQLKYGIKASSGGGRTSARETIGRVCAGAIADKWLGQEFGTSVVAWVSSVGDVSMDEDAFNIGIEPGEDNWTRDDIDRVGCLKILRNPEHSVVDDESIFIASPTDEDMVCYQDLDGKVYNRFGKLLSLDRIPTNVDEWFNGSAADFVHVRCPNASYAARMTTRIREAKHDKDSIGGVITCLVQNVPIGLGEPVFDKLEALLAHGMLSLPATKGFEIGSGFRGTKLRGSQHNDCFIPGEANGTGRSQDDDTVKKSQTPTLPLPLHTKTNYAGGTLGGISNGSNIYFRVAFKPVSTIGKPQETAAFDGEMVELKGTGRHDPCVLPRAVPLVEAMASIVLMDAALRQMSRAKPILRK